MGKDVEPVIFTTKLDGKIIEIVFKPGWRPGKLMEEEKQLLRAYRNEILAEIEIEEKRIIAEERRAAKEVTARKPKQEKLIMSENLSSGRNKYQMRKNIAQVRDIFMQHWDPIGVRDVPQAQDEYDTYVGKAYVMLMQDKATAEQIEAYLYDIATNYIGISASAELKKRCAETAKILQNKRPEFEQAMQQGSLDKEEI